MSGDLIRRGALIVSIMDADGWTYANDEDLAIDLTRNAPAVDAVEVVHARWVNEVEMFPERLGWVKLSSIVCSNCKESNEKEKPYCPNCGAKMDGE